MTLEEIKTALEAMGFKAHTKTLFQLGNVDVQVKDVFLTQDHFENGIVPLPWLQVKVFGEGNEQYAQFDCNLAQFKAFKNEQG